MKNQKPTSLDIAEKAGVSQPTVSRALRNSPLVSEETRARIFAIAQELNYNIQSKEPEKNSKSSKTFSIIFAANPADNAEGLNPFYLAILNAITRRAACLDYGIHLALRHSYKNWHLVVDEALEHSRGIIFIGNHDYMAYKDKLLSLHNRDIPFVAWGPVLANQVGTFINYDNFDGGYIATQHLLSQGHSRIAFIGNTSDFRPEFAARYQGYAKALLEADNIVDPKLRADAQSNDEDGYYAIKRLKEHNEEFTAVFCASDAIAISAMRALVELGFNVPNDIAVVGFDDLPMSKFTTPPLTTVRQDTQRAGELLVEQLIHICNGNDVYSLELPVELIVRQSSKA